MTEAQRLKEERALRSAAEVFTRYGYARTTMADIASGAGMSRPALYLIFPDKDAIFDRVIREMDKRRLAEVRVKIEVAMSLQEKLAAACVDWSLHAVELVDAHPDAADLFDLRFPAVRRAYANFEALLAEMISTEVERSDIECSPTELARVLVFSLRGMRDAASNTKSLRRLIELHSEVIVRAIGSFRL